VAGWGLTKLYQVLTYGNEEKFLIFSSSLLSLLHLSEALQVANIPHLEYTSECSPDQRRVNITQFNNVPIYRVFLMELKHGARGLYVLHLVVYFFGPLTLGYQESGDGFASVVYGTGMGT
jgi:hypothetical protein